MENAVAESIRPHAENVLVLFDHHDPKLRKERRTPGGILLPDDVEPTPVDAIPAVIVAAGPGRYAPWNPSVFLPSECAGKEGKRCWVDNKHSGQPVPINGVEHRMVREQDVLMVDE